MKMTKAEWKALSDRYELALRPTQHAVAMKFCKTKENAESIPNIKFFQGVGTGCKAIGMSANFHITVGITADKFMSTYCAINCGLLKQDQDWWDGVLLSNPPFMWHHSAETAKKHMQALAPVIPEEPYYAMACSTLDSNDIEEPDVIALQLPSQAAFHLLAGFVANDYEQLHFNYSGESNCADTWMKTLKDGKPGLSLGCRGDRATGGLQNGDVRISMTPEDLVRALDGIDALADGGIDYPYYAYNMLKDEF